MDRDFDYKGTSSLLLLVGIVLSILGPIFGWWMLVGAGVSFVLAITCHVSHCSQQLSCELLEIRKRLKAVEDQAADKSGPVNEAHAGN